VSEPEPGAEQAEAPSLVHLLRVLIEDAQTLIEAETGYWRTAFGYALRRIKSIALLAVLALALAFFMLMAIIVGLLLALAPLVGAWGALGLVSVTLGLASVWCVWLAIRRGKRMIRLLSVGKDVR
jgi:hypothetical protein